MKLTVTREAPVREIVPGEGIVLDGRHWVVDEVRMTRDGAALMCNTGGAPPASARRKTFEVKSDETVTLEPDLEDAVKVIALFAKMLADTVSIPVDYSSGKSLSFEVDTGDTKVVSRTWKVVISA